MSDDLFSAMSISGSGMSAQRRRMDAIAKNIANAETTRSENGEVYRRRFVEFTTESASRGGLREPVDHKVELNRTRTTHLPGGASRLQPGDAIARVSATERVDEASGTTYVFEPSHPDADENGYIQVPDINMVTEMVDMVAATRAYEANLAAMKAYQSIFNKSLEI